MDGRGPIGTRLSAVIAVALVAFAVLAIRRPDLEPARRAAELLAVPVPEGISMPATAPLALLLAALAVPFLLLAAGRPAPAAPSAPAREAAGFVVAAPSSQAARRVRWWSVALAGLCLLFAALEWARGPLTVLLVPWLVVLAAGAWAFGSVDRESAPARLRALEPKEALVLVLAGGLFLAFYLWDATSWRYAVIGDEWRFFWLARRMAGEPWWSWNVLEASGAYGDIPVAVTAIQAAFLKAFGVSQLGWAASGAFMLVLGIPGVYVFTRDISGRLGGAMGVAVYASAVLVIHWARLGKPIAFLAPALPLALGFTVLSIRRRSLRDAFLAGAAAGSGLLLFSLSAVVAVPFVAFAFTAGMLFRPPRRAWVARAVAAATGFVAMAIPILVQVDFLRHLFDKNVGDPGLTSKARNTVHAALAVLHFDAADQCLVGEVSEPITAGLVLIGLVWALRRGHALAVGLFATSILVVGPLCHYEYPPLTRLPLLVPAWAALAAAAVSWLRSVSVPRAVSAGTAVTLIAGVVALGLARSSSTKGYLVKEATYVTRLAQTWPDLVSRPLGETSQSSWTVRVVYLVPHGVNAEAENLPYEARGLSARAVSEREWAEALSARHGESLVIALDSKTLLEPPALERIERDRIPVYRVSTGTTDQVAWPPVPLSRDELRAIVVDPGPAPPYQVADHRQDHGKVRVDRAFAGGALSLRGTRYGRGLGAHAASWVKLSFEPRFRTFSGICGIDDAAGQAGSVRFRIVSGGRELFVSREHAGGAEPEAFEVPVGGLSELELVVEPTREDRNGDHADWVQLELR